MEQWVRFSYFLYGEAYPGIHEGLDVHDAVQSNREIRNATVGEVIGPIGGKHGIVKVYDDWLNETIVYMHMKNIKVTVGQ
ncbi:hypothetical protein [Desulfitibacter alkalitolerans]|uniref:hypothetical protein n=1 Tax=Desulfitibacter alkalitolerans TaxID=264641 RepID=UPI0004875886|nr:hypothetical protein [Desulfitibacter alkalitolerans]